VTEDILRSRAGDGRRSEPPAAPGGLKVALDGPSSSGKSTVGAEAARRLSYRFCDTGLLYRAIAWLAVARGVASAQVTELLRIVDEVQLEADERGRFERVRAAGEDVTAEVRGEVVDGFVSEYARVPELRTTLLAVQRSLAADGSIIMAGRDIGTVVLPDADVKIYLDASAEERARRRAAQRRTADTTLERSILLDLQRRDTIDSTREMAPLRLAQDAILIHSDGMDFTETVRAVVDVIRSAEAARAATSAGWAPAASNPEDTDAP
jgi:cytidylate kinase